VCVGEREIGRERERESKREYVCVFLCVCGSVALQDKVRTHTGRI